MVLYNTRQPAIEVLPDFHIAAVDRTSPLYGKVALFFQFHSMQYQEIGMVPDGSYDLLFFITRDSVKAWFYGSVHQIQTMPFEVESDCFGVRFYPGIASKLFPVQICGFSERVPFLLRDHEEYIHQHMYETSFAERADFVTEILTPYVIDVKVDPIVNYCTKRILDTNGTVTVKELTAETGYSDTWLRSSMLSHVGFRPKEFCEIVRFQHSLQLLTDERGALVKAAHESGFFDQSQMNHAYKKLAHINPSSIVEKLQNIYKK